MSYNNDNNSDLNREATKDSEMTEEVANETKSFKREDSPVKTFAELGYSEVKQLQGATSGPMASSDSRFAFITDNDSIGILDTDTGDITKIPGYDASSVSDICFGRGEYLYLVDEGSIVSVLISGPLGETVDISDKVVRLDHSPTRPTLVALTDTGTVKFIDGEGGRVRHTRQQIRQGDAYLVMSDDNVFIADAETLSCYDTAGNLLFEADLRRPAVDIAFMNDRILVAEEDDILQWFDRNGDVSATGNHPVTSLVNIGHDIVFGENEGEVIVCSDGGTVKSVGTHPGEGLIHTPTAEDFVVLGQQTRLLVRDEFPDIRLEKEDLTVGAESLPVTLINPLPVSYEFIISLENETGESTEFSITVNGKEEVTQTLPLTENDYATTPGEFIINTLAPEEVSKQRVRVISSSVDDNTSSTNSIPRNYHDLTSGTKGTEVDTEFRSKDETDSVAEPESNTNLGNQQEDVKAGDVETKTSESGDEWSSACEVVNSNKDLQRSETKANKVASPSNEYSTDPDFNEISHDYSTDSENDEDGVSVPEDERPRQNATKADQDPPAERQFYNNLNTTLTLLRFKDQKAVLKLTVECTEEREFEVTGIDLPNGYTAHNLPDALSGSETTEITIIGPNRPNDEIQATLFVEGYSAPETRVTLPDVDLSTVSEVITTGDPAVVVKVTNPSSVPIFERLVIKVVSQGSETTQNRYVLTTELAVGQNRFIIPANNYNLSDIELKCEHGFEDSHHENSLTVNDKSFATNHLYSDYETSENMGSSKTAGTDELETSRTLGAIAVKNQPNNSNPVLEYFPSDQIEPKRRLSPLIDNLKIQNNSEHLSPPLELRTNDSQDDTIDLGQVDAGGTISINKAVEESKTPTRLFGWSVTTHEGVEIMSVESSDIAVTDPPLEVRARLQHTNDGQTHISIGFKNTAMNNAVLTSIEDSYGEFKINTDVGLPMGTTYFTKTLPDFDLVFESNRVFELQIEGVEGTWNTSLTTVVDVQRNGETAPINIKAKPFLDKIKLVVEPKDPHIQNIHLQNINGETIIERACGESADFVVLDIEIPAEGRSLYVELIYNDKSVKFPYFVEITDSNSIQFKRVAGDVPLSEFFTDAWPTRIETKWISEKGNNIDSSTSE